MSEEKLNIFYELINGFEIVGTLTDDGKKLIKDGVQYLQQENEDLQQENQKLKGVIETYEILIKANNINNWNELKNIIEQDIRQCEELIEMCPKELRNTIIGTRSYEEIIGCNKHILSKMQELENRKV